MTGTLVVAKNGKRFKKLFLEEFYMKNKMMKKRSTFVLLGLLTFVAIIATGCPHKSEPDDGPVVPEPTEKTIELKTGQEINALLVGTGTILKANSTSKAFRFADVPPMSSYQTVVLSSDASEVECIAWVQDNTIYVYAEGYTDKNKLIPLTDMQDMFMNCTALTEIELQLFDTSKVTRMDCTFYGCTALTTLDVSSLNTSSVTTMTGMFQDCKNLAVIDVSGFDTKNVKYMTSMFNGCAKVEVLDVSKFNTENVSPSTGYSGFSYMFNGCSSLKYLDISNFSTENWPSGAYMFAGCKKLSSMKFPKTPMKFCDLEGMFSEHGVAWHLDDLRLFDVTQTRSVKKMFYNNTNIQSFGLTTDSWEKNQITDMSYMFAGCTNLTGVSLWKLDTSNVTTMENMFSGCTNLRSYKEEGYLDDEGYTEYNFFEVGVFIENFNVKNVKTMKNMFYNCSNLNELDVSKWEIYELTNANSMFENCTKLETIYNNGTTWRWTAYKLYLDSSTSTNMFKECTSLVGKVKGATDFKYDWQKTDSKYAKVAPDGYFSKK